MSVEFGIFEGMSFEDYQAIDALNYSSLRNMARSPLSYRWHKDNPQPPTESMQIGHATHSAMLEPDTTGDFVIFDGVRRGHKWDDFCSEYRDRKIITRGQSEYLIGMCVAVRSSKLAMRYLGNGASEVSLVWRDKAADRVCKGRVDKLPTVDGKRLLVDLKTTRDCRPFRFGNEAYRLGYHIQQAMYRAGYFYLTGELLDVVEIVVESKPPHEITVFRFPEEVLQQGQDDYARLVKQLSECEAENHWPPALETETDLSLPSYAFGDLGDDLSDLQLIADEEG